MTNPYEAIRAALEIVRDEGWATIADAALLKLDELERAASEPVAYQYAHQYFGGAKIWRQEQRWNGHTSDEARALYAAPPAPVAEIREVVVTDAVARKVFNAWIDARWRLNEGQDAKYGHAMIAAVRAELGPALGLVEIREPTPEECERICTEYERLLMREGTCGGRDAFDAVRAVMWPKSEGS